MFVPSILLGLKKQCKEYEEWDDNYRQMMALSDIPGSQPDGFLVRFPFYVIAERDAHIVFSVSQNPDWFVDDVYEFGNFLRTLILRPSFCASFVVVVVVVEMKVTWHIHNKLYIFMLILWD